MGHDERVAAAPHETKPVSDVYTAAAKLESPPRALRDVSLELRDKVDAFLAQELKNPLLRNVQTQLRASMAIVDEALTRYRPDQISISYNGGKDCLVLLVVILACLARHVPPSNGSDPASDPASPASSTSFPESFQAVYIVAPDPFPEVDAFVASSGARYGLQIQRYTLPMRQGLESYLADRPNLRAVFVGTRRTDPHGEKLRHFDPTDSGWPEFMRVHPVIDWHYAEIWAFIRQLGIPYCSLYDQGYTSLGGTRDTHPNPQLKRQGDNEAGFRPAYELIADDEERLGRDR